MFETAFNLKSLRADIAKMGIRPGDTVIIHASMKSIGLAQGGPQTVMRAFQKAVTPRGTIIMPTFSYCFEKVYEPAEAYDPATTPSRVGLLSETFRQMKGVVRSLHPTHSVAAWGRLAQELTAGHDDLSGLAAGSPFHRAAQHGAKICMLGCGFTSLSLLHVAEEIAQLPFLPIFNWWHVGWKPAALIKIKGKIIRKSFESVPGCSRNFGVAGELAREHGLIRERKLGDAHVLLADAAAILKLIVKRLEKEKDFLLCPAGACRACDERRVIFELSAPAEKFVGGFMIDVVNRAGIRLAGSAGEDKAAEIIAGRMQELCLEKVAVQRVPVKAWQPGFCSFAAEINGKWESFPSASIAHGPATSAAGIEGQAVILENVADIAKVSKSGAAIAVLWNGYGASVAEFKSLMNSRFKAFVFVDSRFPHNDLVCGGVPAQWIGHFTKPMVLLPFNDAVRIFGRAPVRCRIRVSGRNINGFSSVVSGEISGSGKGIILVCAHHDTTCNSPAPDDNLCGVATMLAIAKKIGGRHGLCHTIRFCSFGAEEILSEGARWYAFESGLARDICFVVNNDGGSARVGVTEVFAAGDSSLTAWIKRLIKKSPLQIQVKESIDPTSDQFPFNALGIPSLWFFRRTTADGRHYHHTVREGFAEISFKRIADLAAFEADMIAALARRDKFPFSLNFPPKMKAYMADKKRAWLEA